MHRVGKRSLKNSRRNGAEAFTLIELLIVIAIIAVVSALLLPVLANSKRSAMETADLAALKQLGLAAELYRSEYDGVRATSVASLIRCGKAPAALAASPVDSWPEGFANVVRSTIGRPSRKTLFKDSFLPIDDFVGANYIVTVESTRAAGWLVAASHPGQFLSQDQMLVGRYQRLLFDTSVVKRSFKFSGGENEEVLKWYTVFTDERLFDDRK